MTPVAVGLIGVGFHARTVHIPALDVVSELRLRAVATSREESARDAAERYRVRGYADYRELLDRADVEAVIIATPPDVHEAICREALQPGKHVFVESPGIPDDDPGPLQGHRPQQSSVSPLGRNLQYTTAVMTRCVAGGGTGCAWVGEAGRWCWR